jgi:UDP-N-acetyl-2-amino-2-deoxyglucuronate dehydrogenase
VSWKGTEERSGGVAMNIGVHFFDLLIWLFGKPNKVQVHVKEPRSMGGFLELAKADVRWFLSVNMEDLPFAPEPGAKTTFRSITMDGQEIEFTKGFTDLHTRVYERTLNGNGFTIEDARPSVELVHRIRQTDIAPLPDCLHPLVTQ